MMTHTKIAFYEPYVYGTGNYVAPKVVEGQVQGVGPIPWVLVLIKVTWYARVLMRSGAL